MAKSMILDMLKTPQQVREEQLNKLREKSLAQASLMQPVRGTTALPGLISGFAQQQMANIPVAYNQMLRRAGGAAGSFAEAANARPEVAQALRQAGVSPEEMQAGRVQEALKGIDYTNVANMKQRYAQLKESGAPQTVLMQLAQMIKEAEATQFSQAVEARKLGIEEAKLKAEQMLNGALGEFDLTTQQGVDDAVAKLMSIGTKDSIALAVRLKNAYKEEQGTMMKDIASIAQQFTNGDMEAARKLYMDMKRESSLLKPTATMVETEYEKAISTRDRINTGNAALKVLSEGNVNTGSFAKTRQGAEKFLGAVFGLDEDKSVQRTEELMARVQRLGGEALASGMFGSGTAISDRDLQTAMSIAGGDQALTPEGMEAIIRANMGIDIYKLQDYNQRLDRIGGGFWEKSFYSKDAYKINVPEAFMPEFSVSRATQKAQNSAGQTIYLYNGDWYNADGTKYIQ
jgi:hypothetical protein